MRKQGLITDEQFKEMSAEYEGIISLANKASDLKAKRDEIQKAQDTLNMSASISKIISLMKILIKVVLLREDLVLV